VVDVTIETDVISVTTSPAKRKRLRLVIAGVSRHDSVTHGRCGTVTIRSRSSLGPSRAALRRPARRTPRGSAPPWPESTARHAAGRPLRGR
jgi:hypothetical protein